jgi:orotidine-5'-phosphate decarboxylase
MLANPNRPLDLVAIALDTDDRKSFSSWCTTFGPRVGVLKVGLETFVRWGRPAVEEAVSAGRAVFLDLKLHDIPNTVAGAVRSAADLGATFLTVHVGGGEAMLRAAVEAAEDRVHILAVTVLTHLDDEDLHHLGMPGEPAERVRRWAGLASEAGVSGVVCSPREAASLRRELPRPFLLVTPGIRPAGSDWGDQRRVATPAEARAAGADLLVIGRPLTRAPDAEKALKSLERELTPGN